MSEAHEVAKYYGGLGNLLMVGLHNTSILVDLHRTYVGLNVAYHYFLCFVCMLRPSFLLGTTHSLEYIHIRHDFSQKKQKKTFVF